MRAGLRSAAALACAMLVLAVAAPAAGQPANPPAAPARAQPTNPPAAPARGQPVRVQPGQKPGPKPTQAQLQQAAQERLQQALGQQAAAGRIKGNTRVADTPQSLSRNSTGTVVFFWLIALLLVAGSIFVISRRNLITAVMGMVGTFFAIAVVYAMLYAHFLAAIQVLVYAGAIMVLFVFVIMILNRPEAEPWSRTGIVGKVVVVGLLLYVVFRLVAVLWAVEPPRGSYAAPLAPSDRGDAEVVDAPDWGSTESVGEALFTGYLFPFEAVSIVLLIAVVGAVAVARPHERRPGAMRAGVAGDPTDREVTRG